MPRHLQLNLEVQQTPVPGLFLQEALQRDLTRFLSDSWPCTAKLDAPDAVWLSSDQSGTAAALELGDGTLGLVSVSFGTAYVQVAAGSDAAAKAGLDKIRALLPRAPREREGRVPVSFSVVRATRPDADGPHPVRALLEEIAGNYADATKDGSAR